MSKTTRILLRALPVVLIGFLAISNVFGINVPTSLNQGTASGTIEKISSNVWGTVVVIVQILAVAAVVFAGIRYMFASANDKADIKKQLVILVLGAVLVFGATFVLSLVQNITGEIAGNTNG